MNSRQQPEPFPTTPPEPNPGPVRVFIVEDDRRPRASLRALLEGTPGFACCGDCATGEAALAGVPAAAADVVLMDLGLPGMSGAQCAAALKGACPTARVLMLTKHDAPERVFEALRAGASGYLLKYEPPARLLEAIAEVHRGGGVMSPTVARLVMESFVRDAVGSPPERKLSDRELDVLRLMRDAGVTTTKEIAERLAISPRTVDGHLAKIYEKLHVHTRTAALAKFLGG